MVGIACPFIQFVMSIRNCERLADISGDPWEGRTLERAIPSPPAEYNFAIILEEHGIDAFVSMKQRGGTALEPDHFQDILLPKNTGIGFIIGGFVFLLGLAQIWRIEWMTIAAACGILAAVVAQFFDQVEPNSPVRPRSAVFNGLHPSSDRTVENMIETIESRESCLETFPC